MVDLARRRLLGRLALGAGVGCLATATLRAAPAQLPLLDPAAPEAQALKYVEDARQAKQAQAGSNCANCGLFLGAAGATRGSCQLFPGKDVKASGWCSSWAPQM